MIIIQTRHISTMSKRKGVSLDEKRQRMLQIFHEKKEFFNLKELEKIAPKEKGIVVQSVKDVVQALLDDGLICSDKIGSSIYFWSFPGENNIASEQRIAEANKKIVETEFKLEKLRPELKKLEVGREDTEERRVVIKEIESLLARVEHLKDQISKFSDSDPKAIAQIKEKAELAKDAANTWTDNIFAIQSWCKRKFDITEETLNKQLNIPSEMDYVE